MTLFTDPDDLREIHHYGFAHRRLPWLFREEPAAAILAMGLMDEHWLRELWLEDTPERLENPPDGLACEVLALDGSCLRIVLFTLPEPWFATGAYFTAAALIRRYGPGQRDDYRFWTIERTREDGLQPEAVLGAWEEDGTHLNFGRISRVSREAFLQAIVARMVPGADPAGLTVELQVAL